jgi:hypothetical protein
MHEQYVAVVVACVAAVAVAAVASRCCLGGREERQLFDIRTV